MEKCQSCNSERILSVQSHASDMHSWSIGDIENDGYLPTDLGIGGSDDCEFELCLDCGMLQGEWPLPLSKMEKKSAKAVANKIARGNIPKFVIDTIYQPYINNLMSVAINPNKMPNLNVVFSTLIGHDEDLDRIVSGLVSLYETPETGYMFNTMIQYAQEWDRFDELYNILPEYVTEEEDEDEDDWDC